MIAAAHLRASTTTALTVLVAIGLAAPSALAQSPQPDARWQAWLGCWEPTAVVTPAVDAPEDGRVCVLPRSTGSGVEAVSIVDGGVVEREILEAEGVRRSVARDGCSGWESMEWSDDGRRLFQRSEYECAGGLQRGSTGALAILPSGEWLTIQAIAAGEQTDVRVLRYRAVDPERVSPDIARALEGRAFAVEAARMAAASRLTIERVIEATRKVDVAVVEAWLIEQKQGFEMDAARLVALADAGVPERVIDLMVALSYPAVFSVNLAAREGEFRPEEGRVPPSRRPGMVGVMNPWLYPGYGWGPGRGYGGWYGPPVIVVRDGGSRNQGGRLVSGSGYTRGNRGGSGTTSNPPSTSSGGSQPSPSADPGSGSGSSGSGRTAQPRSGS